MTLLSLLLERRDLLPQFNFSFRKFQSAINAVSARDYFRKSALIIVDRRETSDDFRLDGRQFSLVGNQAITGPLILGRSVLDCHCQLGAMRLHFHDFHLSSGTRGFYFSESMAVDLRVWCGPTYRATFFVS
ncbi:MAG TPA: hypothetical protein DEB60_10725, partial [Brevundimonas sp.]|nr:hypothetical protein [Brevundimonas sp.]